MTRWFLFALAAACTALLTSAHVRADDPVSSNVRFNREIIRILQRRCLACHSAGGLDVPLASYRDVRDWSRAIREEVVEQRMPPSSAAPGFGHFDNPLRLTVRETSTLLAWLDGGMPRGDEKDLPPPFRPSGESGDTPPDVQLLLPQQAIPAGEDLVIRRITIDPPFASDRLVERIVVRPGSRAVTRAAIVFAGAADEHWIGTWVPWQNAVGAPAGHAFRLAATMPLTVMMYYRGGDTAVVDHPVLDVYFAKASAHPVDTLSLEVGAGTSKSVTLPAATTFWAMQPVFSSTTQSVEVRTEKPDGAVDVLLWAPVARFEWPEVLVFDDPITLPARSRITVAVRDKPETTAAQSTRIILSGWTAMPHRP